MTWMKRIFLFLITNILVIVTITITMNVLGIQPYLNANGLNPVALAEFCLIWGMGASFISLALSRIMAKWMMKVQVIDPQNASGAAQELVTTVHRLAEAAGLPAMPEVGVYDSPELNAFATGPTKSRALVAVSTGLLASMSRSEIEGVLGHEITHVANGDMVTMTLIQGVINAFVMFIARVVAYLIARRVERGREMVRFGVTIVLEIGLSLLGSIVVAAFSRRREYRADAGGARLAGRENMISALEALQRRYQPAAPKTAFSALGIAGRSGGLMAFFASHPPIAERIAALRAGA
jgi:heat shock protein HtpX